MVCILSIFNINVRGLRATAEKIIDIAREEVNVPELN
jgi:hypothetical protein